MTTGQITEMYGVGSLPDKPNDCKDTYYTMIACKGKTYAKRKLDLLRQLGHYNLPKDLFDGLTENQIDQKARSIIMS